MCSREKTDFSRMEGAPLYILALKYESTHLNGEGRVMEVQATHGLVQHMLTTLCLNSDECL